MSTHTMVTVGASIVAALTLTACSASSDTSDSTSQPEPVTSSSCASGELGSGCWDGYGPQVKARIDKAAADGDCAALQDEFDQADANNDATMARLGHNNADLMEYIDQAMQSAGC